MQEIAKHKFAYLILSLGIITVIALYMAAWPDRNWQRILAVIFAAFYIVWGITTHVKAAHVTRQIILEYLGIGLLGGSLLFVLTL